MFHPRLALPFLVWILFICSLPIASPSLSQGTTPPRGIADILTLLQSDQSGVVAKARSLADGDITETDPEERATALMNRAEAAEALGRAAQAIADSAEAATVGATSDAHEFIRTGQVVAAATYRAKLGEFGQGLADLGKAIDLIRGIREPANPIEQGHRLGRIVTFESLYAQIAYRLGDRKSAEDALDRALSAESRFENLLSMARGAGVSLDERTLLGVRLTRGSLRATRAQMAAGAGDVERAEEIARDALDYIEEIRGELRGISALQVADARLQAQEVLVDILTKRGDLAAAEALARRALVEVVEAVGPTGSVPARALAILNDVFLDQGRFEDVETLSTLSVKGLEEGGAEPGSLFLMEARRQRIAALVGQRRWSDAAPVATALIGALNGLAPALAHAVMIDQPLAVAAYRGGLAADASRLAKTRLDWAIEAHGDSTLLTLEAKAFSEAADGRLDALATTLPAWLEAFRGATLTPLEAARMEVVLDVFAPGAVGDAAKTAVAFRLAETLLGGRVAGTVAASAARAAAKVSGLDDLVRKAQDLKLQEEAVANMLSRQLSLPAGQRNQGAIDDLREAAADIRDNRADLEEDLTDDFPEYANLVRPGAPDGATVGKALKPEERLVLILPGETATHIWTIKPDGAVVGRESALTRDQIEQAVGLLRASLDPSGITSLDDFPTFDVATANSLYDGLLKPAAADWQGAATLVIATKGALASMPFSLLVTKQTALPADGTLPFDGYRGVPWLIREVALARTPSASALVALRQAPTQAAERTFLGFGDPDFGSPPMETQVASRGVVLRAAPKTRGARSLKLSDLPQLPETADEIRAIGQTLGADEGRDLHLQRNASEKTVRSMAEDDDLALYRVVSFATHGLVPGDLDGLAQPALALSNPGDGADTDGLLTTDDILGLKLNADWVLLSACNTGAAGSAGAEAFSGLGRAFFYAGARALLLSNWPVHSGATRDLMVDLFSQPQGTSRAGALKAAMGHILDAGGYQNGGQTVFSYGHPIFWAPFTLLGDPG